MLDIGTGDGRFVSASAKADPKKFYVGIDANAKPLEKLSTKITRKPAKGGLSNAMFVQAAVEDLPSEFDGIASDIYINFPWGSLLRAVTTGEMDVLGSLHRILKPEGRLTTTISIDPVRDRSELDRLGIPDVNLSYLNSTLAARYLEYGFRMTECNEIPANEWSRIETTWARKLGGNAQRIVFRLKFIRVA